MSIVNKNWGEFSMMMVTGIGICIAGIFSEDTATNASTSCSSTIAGSDGTVTPSTLNAVTSGGAVAIGTGISIILFALSNKFNLLSTPRGRSIFMMVMATAMVIIGGISLSIKVDTNDDDDEGNAQKQARLGGIILGFGIGIVLAALPKLIISLATKGKMADDANYLKKVNQLVLAGSTTAMALFVVIIGSWSWNINNKCKASSVGKDMNSSASPAINGIFTVLSALLCVYSGVYFGFRAADSPIADVMSNFKKIQSGISKASQSAYKSMQTARAQPKK